MLVRSYICDCFHKYKQVASALLSVYLPALVFLWCFYRWSWTNEPILLPWCNKRGSAKCLGTWYQCAALTGSYLTTEFYVRSGLQAFTGDSFNWYRKLLVLVMKTAPTMIFFRWRYEVSDRLELVPSPANPYAGIPTGISRFDQS